MSRFIKKKKNDILIKCINLKKSYGFYLNKLEVLKGVTFDINRKEITYIVGRSGSGKSTLLHILGGLDKADSGGVFFKDKNILKLKERELAFYRNKKIGFVFQFYYLLPELNLLENVMLPALIGRIKKKAAKDRAIMLLSEVGLYDKRFSLPKHLSGGELQRGAISRALINSPEIVFCDEPTGNLDEENKDMVMALILKINREENVAFCIVTHDKESVLVEGNIYTLKGGLLIKRL